MGPWFSAVCARTCLCLCLCVCRVCVWGWSLGVVNGVKRVHSCVVLLLPLISTYLFCFCNFQPRAYTHTVTHMKMPMPAPTHTRAHVDYGPAIC